MKFLRTLVTVIATFLLFIPLSSMAEDITISLEAVVDWNNTPADLAECLGLEQGVNDTVTGLFIYSTVDEFGNPVPDTDADIDEFATHFQDYPNSMLVEVGDYWFVNDPDDFMISLYFYDRIANTGADVYRITTSPFSTNSTCIEMTETTPGIYITDTNGDAITTVWPVTLPKTPPDLDTWEGPQHFTLGDLFGTMTSIQRVYLDIVDALKTLIENNPLDAEQELGLYQKAASALTKIDGGKVDQGCQQLSAFICQLEALMPMFEQTDDYDLASEILGTAYEIFGAECSASNLQVMECPMEDWLNN